MKVLHVINSLAGGGAEKFLSDLTPQLSRIGVKCEVYTLTDRGDRYSETLKKKGIKVTCGIPRSSPYNPRHLFPLLRNIKSVHPDIIHVHLFPAQYWCLFLVPFIQNIPIITTEHSSHNRRMGNKILSILDSRLYRVFRAIIAISHGVKDRLIEHLGSKSKDIYVIPNGIELDSFQNIARTNKSTSNIIYIGMAASFSKAKDQGTLVRALSALPDKYRLVFAGDGVLREGVEALAKNLGVLWRVQFLGYVQDINKFLSLLDVYIQSSFWEGFGIAALEAMAAGLPVAGTAVPGLFEVISDAGQVFPVGDHQALTRILLHWEDSRVREKIGIECQKKSSGFSINNSAESYKSIYESISFRGAHASY